MKRITTLSIITLFMCSLVLVSCSHYEGKRDTASIHSPEDQDVIWQEREEKLKKKHYTIER